jgi:hypothetical protein
MYSEAGGYRTGGGGARRLVAIAAAVLIAVLLVAWFLSQHLTLTTTPPVAPRHSPPAPAAAYPRTQAGAVGAATFYLTTLNGPMLLEPEKLATFERQAGSGQYADQLVKDSQDGASRLDSVFGVKAAKDKGVTVVLSPQPLAYKPVSEWNGWSTSVAVWWIELVQLDGVTSMQGFWQTATISLVWEKDSWRISNAQSDEGPGPGGESNQLPDQLRGFSRYRYAP